MSEVCLNYGIRGLESLTVTHGVIWQCHWGLTSSPAKKDLGKLEKQKHTNTPVTDEDEWRLPQFFFFLSLSRTNIWPVLGTWRVWTACNLNCSMKWLTWLGGTILSSHFPPPVFTRAKPKLKPKQKPTQCFLAYLFSLAYVLLMLGRLKMKNENQWLTLFAL